MNGYSENDWLQAGTLAGVTFTFTHETLYVTAHKITVGFFVTAFKVRYDTFVGRIV